MEININNFSKYLSYGLLPISAIYLYNSISLNSSENNILYNYSSPDVTSFNLMINDNFISLVDDKKEYDKHGYSSYKSGISLFSDPFVKDFKDLHDHAFEACYRYINASNWDKPDANSDDLGMLNHAWVSIYGNGHFIPEHVHTDSHLSWVFYGASDGETGKIIFRNPAAPVFRMSYQEDAELFFETWKLPPEVGCFYVFPSFMSHWTEQHLGEGDRIIYSGNFVFKRSVTGHGTFHRASRIAKDEP